MYLHPSTTPIPPAPSGTGAASAINGATIPEHSLNLSAGSLDRSFVIERSFFGWCVQLIDSCGVVASAEFGVSDDDWFMAHDLGTEWVNTP